jgi:hypothetical protein
MPRNLDHSFSVSATTLKLVDESATESMRLASGRWQPMPFGL